MIKGYVVVLVLSAFLVDPAYADALSKISGFRNSNAGNGAAYPDLGPISAEIISQTQKIWGATGHAADRVWVASAFDGFKALSILSSSNRGLPDGKPDAPVDLYSLPPANAFYFSSAGARFSIAPSLGHAPGDTQRTSVYDMATSEVGANIQEFAAFVSMDATKGYSPDWAPGAQHASGDEVVANGGLYIETTPSCASSKTDNGPAGVEHELKDGTCSWKYEVPTSSNTNGKSALGVTINAFRGAGHTWGVAVDCGRQSGYAVTNFSACLENDFDIFDGDHPPGTPSGGAYQMILSGFSANGEAATAAIAISTANTGLNYQNHIGVGIINPLGAKDEGFLNGANSIVGFLNNGHTGAVGFEDEATTPIAFAAAGTYSSDAFDTTKATISGNQVAFNAKAGQRICLNNGDVCQSYFGDTWNWLLGGAVAMFIQPNLSLNLEGPVVKKSYTVNTLPVGAKGAEAFVTDAKSCTFLGPVTGGGSTFCPVVNNGREWVGGG